MICRHDFWQVLTLASGFAIGFMGTVAAEAMPPGDRVVMERIFNQQGLVRAVEWRRSPGGSGFLVDRRLSVPIPARMIFSNAGPADGARVRGVDGVAGSWRSGSLMKVAAKTSREKGNSAVTPTAKQSAATPSVKGDATRVGGVSAARKQSANSDKNDKPGAQVSTSKQKTSSSGRDAGKTAQPATDAKKGTKSVETDGKSRQTTDTKTTVRSAKDSKQTAPPSEKVARSTGTDGKIREAVDTKTTARSAKDRKQTARTSEEAKKGTKAAGAEAKREVVAADTKTTARSAKDRKRTARTSEEANKGTKAASTDGGSRQEMADSEQTDQSADDSETAAQASGSSKQEQARRVRIESMNPPQRGIGQTGKPLPAIESVSPPREIGQTGNPLPVIESVSPPQQTADNRAALANGQENRLLEMNSRNFQPPLTEERVARSSFENRNNVQGSAFAESIRAPEPPMTAMYVPREMPARIPQQQSIPQPVQPRSPVAISRGFGGSVQVSGPMIFQYTDSGRIVGCSVRNIRLDYGWCATFISAKGTDNCKVILRGDSRVLSVGCT